MHASLVQVQIAIDYCARFTFYLKNSEKIRENSQYNICMESILTLFTMGLFGAAHGWTGGEGGWKKPPPSLKSVKHILQ